MSVASCPSATKGKVTLLLVLDSSETCFDFWFGVATRRQPHSPVSGIVNFGCSSERMTYGDYQQQISFLAVTLKQNRQLLSLCSRKHSLEDILRTASELSNIADKLLRQFDITPAAVQRSSHSAGSWDGRSLQERDICTHGSRRRLHMSRLLDRMEKSGWITRERAEG